MRYKNIFLDLDGTVVKSDPGITRGLTYMFNHLGIPVPEESELFKFIGPPVKYVLKEYGIHGEANDKAYALYREYYDKKGIYEMELYEGMAELLEELNKASAAVHMATAKRENQTEIALEHMKVRHYFKHVFCAEADKNILLKKDILKKALDVMGEFPDAPVMIGDRDVDIVGGKENGFDTIGVLFGYGSEKEIKGSRPTHIAADMANLRELLLG